MDSMDMMDTNGRVFHGQNDALPADFSHGFSESAVKLLFSEGTLYYKKSQPLGEFMSKTTSYIDSLNDTEQVLLLQKPLEDRVIREKAEAIALEMLHSVNKNEVADEVSFELDMLDVQTDVWNASGRQEDGYVDPYELAWKVFDAAIAPFITELERWQNLNLPEQAAAYCCGLLTGIQQFMDSGNEILDWCVDAPETAMASIVEKISEWLPEKNVRQVQECYDQLLKDKNGQP